MVGRPNVGKSTLVNALVGEKVAITSSKPQTTRRTIRGVVHREEGQLILVDTPGVHRPKTLLGERLNATVQETLADVDVIAQCIPATDPVGPGDRFIANVIEGFPRARRVVIVTKCDQASKEEVARRLLEVSTLLAWDVVIPVSAKTGEGLETLVSEAIRLLPESPRLYEEGVSRDDDTQAHLAELIREAALEDIRDELPHSLAATIDEVVERDDGLLHIFAHLIVERDSQKGIIIGKKGQRLKEIGTKARGEIESHLGRRVYLSLQVSVLGEWQSDPKKLGKLGF